jgi:hypothetical protein
LPLELPPSGALSLTTVRLLQPHLTQENYEAVLARAASKPRAEINALVAELAPQPDVQASVRKLPDPQPPRPSAPEPSLIFAPEASSMPRSAMPAVSGDDGSAPAARPDIPTRPPSAVVGRARPIVRPSTRERYRVQLTICQATHDKLRRLQVLMRRENPSGDVAVIFEQAVDLMLEKVEKAKIGGGGVRSSRSVDRHRGGRVITDPFGAKGVAWCGDENNDGRRNKDGGAGQCVPEVAGGHLPRARGA